MKHIILILLGIMLLNSSYAQTSDRFAFNFSVSPGFYSALTLGKTAYPGPYSKASLSFYTEASLTIKNKKGYFYETGLGYSIFPYLFLTDGSELSTGIPNNHKVLFGTMGIGNYFGLTLKAGKRLGEKYDIAVGIMPQIIFKNKDSSFLSSDTAGTTTVFSSNNWGFSFTGEVRRSIGHTKNGEFKAGIFVSYSLRPLLKGYYTYNALPEPNKGEIKAFPHFAGIKFTYSFSCL